GALGKRNGLVCDRLIDPLDLDIEVVFDRHLDGLLPAQVDPTVPRTLRRRCVSSVLRQRGRRCRCIRESCGGKRSLRGLLRGCYSHKHPAQHETLEPPPGAKPYY